MRIGIIGGGFFWGHWGKQYGILDVDTPYGKPSDKICYGKYGQHEVFTLQRHGIRHELSPAAVPWKANVYAMHMQELDFIIHVAVCGALIEDCLPGHFVLFDQFLDFTKNRDSTFGPPVICSVTHVDTAKPTSTQLISLAHTIYKGNNIPHYFNGTMVTEEGPRFATDAEANMFRMLGGTVINHTSTTEIVLCNEIGLPVLGIALITNKARNAQEGGYSDIASNIQKYKSVIPSAIGTFLANVDATIIDRLVIRPFDVSKLDLRPIT